MGPGIPLLTGSEPRSIQPVTSSYTGYANNDRHCLLSGTHTDIYNWKLTVVYATF